MGSPILSLMAELKLRPLENQINGIFLIKTDAMDLICRQCVFDLGS